MKQGPDPIAEFLDGDGSTPDLRAEDRDAVAAELFVHGVLSHFATEQAALDARVDAALGAIDAGGPVLADGSARADGPLRHRPRAAAALVAAAVIVAVLVWATIRVGGPARLEAQARRIVAVANTDLDLEYAFRLTTSNGSELDGRLYVRGIDRFAAELDTPTGALLVGYDGTDAWLVPTIEFVPVLVSEFPETLREQLWQLGTPLPFMSLARLLEGLDTDFDLARGPGQRIAGALRGRGDRMRPTRIDVAADPSSAIVRSAVIGWDGSTSMLSGANIELTLVDDRPRDAAFYSHASHHDADRMVRRISSRR